MQSFVPPPIATKNLIGKVELVPSFRIDLELEPRVIEHTVRGERIHQRVLGGIVSGPRLGGDVFGHGSGEYGVVRKDSVEEWFTRFMIKAANGEWLYTHLLGYVRLDGYARFQAVFDADVQGPHAWLNESMFIGTVDQTENGQRRSMTYYEVT
jgi:hypothetical protein